MKLSDVTGDRRTAKISFPGRDGQEDMALTVVWNPSAYTPAFEAELLARAEEHPTGAMAFACTSLLVEWDLENDEGPIPLTEEGLRNVPLSVMAQIFKQIRIMAQPTSEEGKASGDGSQQTETSEGSLGGTP
jgi:hypothetical protein